MDNQRLISLDFMRGLIMVLLALESTEFYAHALSVTDKGSFGNVFIGQFFHNHWLGMNFWDLIQPAFMFMAGAAMAYSLMQQKIRQVSWKARFLKVLKRSLLLLLWGLFKRINNPDWLSLSALDFTDVLTQLAFASLIAFLLFDFSIKYQLLSCGIILLGTDLAYRFFNVSGFDTAYAVPGHTFGNYIDWILFDQKGGSYVFINWLPTAVHTIAGTIVGKLLMQKDTRISIFTGFGLLLLTAGYGLSYFDLTPIIKPIASSSFVMASLGYCVLALAFIYWWIDVKQHKAGLNFFLIMGVNPIFIYLFCDIVGRHWLNEYTHMLVSPVFSGLGLSGSWILIAAALCTFFIEWSICYFLYKKKIFFKL